ncbi:hypothetical protein HII31_11177 [Pseudocercospora fuligena]|uniref:Uncharacterized protein n=1 Tax=Pseudocercospora fuligena TaxID=685502 RepID=A0A8H6RAP5_9PEZI|nr:hypothetical protein HII31_11177 [Pseudocercospora fuligena]
MATAPTSVGARVVNTFELLEPILLLASDEYDARLENPFRNHKTDREVSRIKAIFRYQRVCRAFRDTIANSTPLQAAIFSARPKDDSKADDCNENPFIRRSGLAISAQRHMSMFVSANRFEVPTTSVYLSFTPQERPRGSKNWNSPEASWCRMFLYAGTYRVESFIWQLPSDDRYHKRYVPVKLTNPTLGQLVVKMYEVLGVEPWVGDL